MSIYQVLIIVPEEDPDFQTKWFLVGFMMLNATLNNISIISEWSGLFVEETEEIHRSAPSH